MSNNKKIVVGVVIGAVASTIFSFCLAETLIESSKVSYVDNSNIGATNVQAAIDGTCTKFSSELQNFLLKVYPVGSIYISYSATNPQTLFGGTWEVFGKGQTIVGIDTSSTEFKTLGQTGGAKSISYTPGGTIGSTGLNINQIPSHTHSIPALSGSTNETGSHVHQFRLFHNQKGINNYSVGPDAAYLVWDTSVKWTDTVLTGMNWTSLFNTEIAGSHTHTVTTTKNTTGAAGKGTTSDGHTHSFTGTAATLNNLQPYITVYMWRRTK